MTNSFRVRKYKWFVSSEINLIKLAYLAKKKTFAGKLSRGIFVDISSSNMAAMMSLDNNVVVVTSCGHFAMFVLIEV